MPRCCMRGRYRLRVQYFPVMDCVYNFGLVFVIYLMVFSALNKYTKESNIVGHEYVTVDTKRRL
jgi:hypothetical protein